MRINLSPAIKYLLFVALMLTLSAYAQNFNNGTVMGTVTDQTGAAVPDAIVLLTRPNTQLHREARTDAAGNYQIQQVPPGPDYQIEIQKTGFQKVQIGAVNLSAAQQLRVDGQLQIGSVTEIVKVEASPAQSVSPQRRRERRESADAEALRRLRAFVYNNGYGYTPAKLTGKQAPTFALKDSDGKSFEFESTRGKTVLLNFWSST